jgi:hypothetical protein
MRFPEHWPSIKPTSCVTYIRRSVIATENEKSVPKQGHAAESEGKVDLRDVLIVETAEGERIEFEVVGIVEDEEHQAYAVCYSEKADDFVVTDDLGKLLEDKDLAQEILDDFFVFAEESEDAEEVEGVEEHT